MLDHTDHSQPLHQLQHLNFQFLIHPPDAGFTFPAPSGVTVTLSLYVTTSSGLQEKINKEAISKHRNFFITLI